MGTLPERKLRLREKNLLKVAQPGRHDAGMGASDPGLESATRHPETHLHNINQIRCLARENLTLHESQYPPITTFCLGVWEFRTDPFCL